MKQCINPPIFWIHMTAICHILQEGIHYKDYIFHIMFPYQSILCLTLPCMFIALVRTLYKFVVKDDRWGVIVPDQYSHFFDIMCCTSHYQREINDKNFDVPFTERTWRDVRVQKMSTNFSVLKNQFHSNKTNVPAHHKIALNFSAVEKCHNLSPPPKLSLWSYCGYI